MSDLKVLNYLSDLLNDYGLDWDQSPGDIGIIMKLYNDGVISQKDTNGVELRFGDWKAIEEMIHMVAKESI